MKHYAGLDLSIKETSVCIVYEPGKLCRRAEGSLRIESIQR
mgnify:CR=1 FL=1|jgi:hypothetical protein